MIEMAYARQVSEQIIFINLDKDFNCIDMASSMLYDDSA